MVSYKTSEYVMAYDQAFPLQLGEALMFCESTGVSAETEHLTLISLAYNKNGHGRIRQLLAHAIGGERNLIRQGAIAAAGFKDIMVTASWFQRFLFKRAEVHGLKLELQIRTHQVSIAKMYAAFDQDMDGPDLASKSRDVYRRLSNGSVDALEEYLEYNRRHTLAYARYIETRK